MKDLKSYIKKRGGGYCATIPKALLDVFKIKVEQEFNIEAKTIKGVKTIILREVEK